jgi:hypothetical protein
MVPKDIWFPSTFELLLAGSEKAVEFIIPTPHGRRQLTRVCLANILDEGLRIGGSGRRMNSKVRSDKQGEVSCVLRISVVLNWLNLNLSLAGLFWPFYIGDQVSRNWLGSIQITMSVYDVISYFDYIYA